MSWQISRARMLRNCPRWDHSSWLPCFPSLFAASCSKVAINSFVRIDKYAWSAAIECRSHRLSQSPRRGYCAATSGWNIGLFARASLADRLSSPESPAVETALGPARGNLGARDLPHGLDLRHCKQRRRRLTKPHDLHWFDGEIPESEAKDWRRSVSDGLILLPGLPNDTPSASLSPSSQLIVCFQHQRPQSCPRTLFSPAYNVSIVADRFARYWPSGQTARCPCAPWTRHHPR